MVKLFRSIALTVVLTTACVVPPNVSVSPSPSGPGTVALSAQSSASTPAVAASSVASAPTTARLPTLAHASDGLETFALGNLSGEIAFVTRQTRHSPTGLPIYKELWAMPLDGSAPRLSAIYRAGFDPRMSDTNVLARQFSPDSRRLLLSVGLGPVDPAYQLVVLELATGTVTRLLSEPAMRSHERSPAWSPDGRYVAFSRRAYPTQGIDGEIWVAGSDGRGSKRLYTAVQGGGATVWGWTADSRLIGFDPLAFESAPYALLDLDGNITRITDRSVTSTAAVSWRARVPMFAGSFADSPRTATRIDLLIADRPGEPTRTLVSQPADTATGSTGLTDPRWDPSGTDVLIYRRTGADSTTVIHDLSTGARREIGSRVSRAEWTPNGGRIVTVEEHPSTGPHTLFVFSRDGQVVRSELGLPPDTASGGRIYRLGDLAVRSY